MQLDLCESAPAEWLRLPISAVCKRFTSGGTPSRRVPDYFVGEIPWVKTQELTDCVLEETGEHISQEAIAASSAKLLPERTVLMAMYGATVGQLGVLAKPMTCNQACAAMVVDSDKADYRYLYYQLMAARKQIKSLSTGAAQQNLSGAQIKQFVLPFPPLWEQSAIADVLWQIDRRVTLLRQTNATLESIVQALFKSWFIDFNPVRAKAEGREPEGMDAAFAALFPAEFEESALGLIPKGWHVGSVEDLFVLQRGFDLPASQRTDGPFTVFAASGPHGTHSECMVQGPGVITGRSGVIGRVFFAHEDYWPLNTSLWVKQFKVASPAYAFQYLQTIDLARLNAGSAVPTLNRNHVHAQPAVIPPTALVAAYTAVAMPLLERFRANAEHAARLEELRDTLLPRLISGKLRLPEAQAELGETLHTESMVR